MKTDFRIYLICLALFAQGCGFTLRNNYELPEHLKSLQMLSSERHSRLSDVLTKRLTIYGARLHSASKGKTNQLPTIYLYPETLERRLLSLFPSGQVAEYRLIYQVRVEFQKSQDTESELLEFELSRDYQDDPDQVLAKSRELDLVLNEMRQEASDKIIQLLSYR